MSEDTSSSPLSSDSNSDNNFEEIQPPNTELVPAETDANNFDKNLPETVSLICAPNGSKIYLVGTAHFSMESQDDVAKVIQTVQPDIVIVELCKSRINILQLDEKTLLEEAKNINYDKIRNTIKQNGLYNGLMYILLLNMSAHFTKELGMAPGGEFRRAFSEARQIPNCEIRLGDRPVEITIQRAISKLSWFQTLKLGWHLISCKDPISKEDVENCKRRDILEEILAEMTDQYPALGEVFVRERDSYLTHSLQQAAVPIRVGDEIRFPKVVGVVGMGHIPGILKLWPVKQAPMIPQIIIIPPQTMCSKVLIMSFKLSLLTFGGYVVYRYVPGMKKVPVYCNTAFLNLFDYAKSIYNKAILKQ